MYLGRKRCILEGKEPWVAYNRTTQVGKAHWRFRATLPAVPVLLPPGGLGSTLVGAWPRFAGPSPSLMPMYT